MKGAESFEDDVPGSGTVAKHLDPAADAVGTSMISFLMPALRELVS